MLEVGYGQGANRNYYPNNIDLIGLDPDISKLNLNEEQLFYKEHNSKFALIKGVCESLPFKDNTFDTILTTLVFCTVTDPVKSLQEIQRVLKPGGKYISVEHIIADTEVTSSVSPTTTTTSTSYLPKSNILSFQQQALDPLQVVLADGCHLNRHTDKLFLASITPTYKSSTTNTDIGRGKNENKGLFNKLLFIKYADYDSQWPISRQVFTVLEKSYVFLY